LLTSASTDAANETVYPLTLALCIQCTGIS